MSIALHPGAINTDLARHISTLIQRLGRIVTYSVSYGAINSLYAGTAPAAGKFNGKVSACLSKIGSMMYDAPTYVLYFIVSHPLGTSHTSK